MLDKGNVKSLDAIRIMSGDDRTRAASVIRLGAACAEPLYTAATRFRNAAYNHGWKPAHRADLPVISIGNLTTGGTGKTPMVIHITALLHALGRHPAVLLRGYKSTETAGSDEQRLLSQRLPGTPVIANPDRVAAARSARRHHPEVDAIVLDDGFQHRRLHRDLDLVLIDATNPFGFDHVLPRGLMREPPTALGRADAVLVTHAERLDEEQIRNLERRIEHYHGRPPAAWFEHVWSALLDNRDERVEAADARVLPFCGIGNPRAFFDQASRSMTPIEPRVFADHHAYTTADLRSLCRAAADHRADALLTTEKDWVKLQGLVESMKPAVPIWRPQLRLEPVRGGDALNDLIRSIIP